MERKQDKPQKRTNIGPECQGTKKRTRKTNENLVSDTQSSHSESERAELDMDMSSHGYNLRRKDPPVLDDDDANINTNSIPERNLQPPVFINTNLRKIKVEDDYIPVKKEDDEEENQEIENDNNDYENEQVRSPSFSVLSSDNNNRSTQNVDEAGSKYSEVGQQQQQQEVVAENDATSGNIPDTPTGNNEKAIGLQEEIKECTQKILFLSQEKMEIQTTLQNEIDELKLVNGHRNTKIQELNSMISQQWTENNQLKSQVAEQQKQIEELNKKLQSNPGNQQSFENLKASQAQTRYVPAKFLSHVFDYLDIKSLKESRLVCRHWKNEAGKILLSNFYLVCDEKERCEISLINWLRNSHSTSKATAQKLWSKDKNAQGTLQLLRKFKRLRISITELKFSPYPSNMENLYEILQLLPNLQVLETNALDLSPQQKWLVNDKMLYNGKSIKLQLLVQKLRTMKKLKLDFCFTNSAAQNFFYHHQQFVPIQSLEIHATGKHFMKTSMNRGFYDWTITRFTFSVQGNYDVGLIRSFLMRISSSLKHLKLLLQTSQGDSLSDFQPWTDNFIIPLGLLGLETLEIQQASDRKRIAVKCIVAALQLPRLKKLSVEFIPEELEQVIYSWNSHESARGRKLASQSLEELETTSWIAVNENKRRVSGNPWPGLKSLKCSWNSQEPFDASFFSQLRNLERLDLSISKYNSTFPLIPDNKNDFQLGDLKHLKSFRLNAPENEQRFQDFASGLVHSDLKFMKSLQYVQFHRVVIDDEPLKTALGPHVPIIFTH